MVLVESGYQSKNQTSKKLVKCYVYEFFGNPGLHHT
jgi:hypothetical protein